MLKLVTTALTLALLASTASAQTDEELHAQAARVASVRDAIAIACYEELTVDRFRALTTPACYEYFVKSGMARPTLDTPPADPAPAE